MQAIVFGIIDGETASIALIFGEMRIGEKRLEKSLARITAQWIGQDEFNYFNA